MRKYQQKQILELVETLREAAKEIKRLLSHKNTQAAIQLLADSQDVALDMGNLIEELEGENINTVHLLVEYCELLYRASVEISDAGGNAAEQINRLQKQLFKIERGVRSELKPNKIEIAFLPYKASMWDTFESIWRAAGDNPQCDAYVVPIPYYDRLPDGKFGQMHYEGDQYPDYVPIIDWRKYNVAERRPDAVFVHNPYDGSNLVTSIHPDYYSEKLKDLTELLAYVPYFVVSDSVPDHFCALPGTLYSNRVYVQSEKIRGNYIEVLKRFEKKYNCTGRFGKTQDKFIALGSPKFDKIINSKPDDFSLPEDWARLAERPDGSRKKIVLYNTSVSAILQGNELYVQKIKSVLECFRNRDDTILWWRPHPLNEATYGSMRPRLLDEYERIVNNYRSDGFGIFDDTPDLHRALCIPDMYYGDWSSLVSMFGVSGKPIVIQDILSAGNGSQEQCALHFLDFVFDDQGNAWGYGHFINGLFKLDFSTDRAKFMAKNDMMPGAAANSHRISMFQQKIIAFPHHSSSVFLYDTVSGASKCIELDTSHLINNKEARGFAFHSVIEHIGKYYCFGVWCDSVVTIDCEHNSMTYSKALFERIGARVADGKSAKYPIYFSDCSDDGYVTMLFKDCGDLIRYNLESQEIAVLASDTSVSSCCSATYDGNHYWLINNACDVLLRWNVSSGELKRYANFPDGYSAASAHDAVLHLCDCGGYLLLFPTYGNMIVRFDKESGTMSEYLNIPMPPNIAKSQSYKFDLPKRIGNRVFAFARFNKTIYELNIDDGEIIAHRFVVEPSEHQNLRQTIFSIPKNTGCEWINNFVANESGVVGGIEGLLSGIPEPAQERRNVFLQATASPEGRSGKAILRHVLDLSLSGGGRN